jgi:hypothetical protein
VDLVHMGEKPLCSKEHIGGNTDENLDVGI